MHSPRRYGQLLNTSSKLRAIAITTAAAIGVGLGSFGIAAAANGAQTDSGPAAEVEKIDGIDYQFEGEQIGDGIADPNEATEAQEADDDDDLAGLATISADEAQAAAQAVVAGTVDKVELDNENGDVVYSVEISDGNGNVVHQATDNDED